MDPYTPASTEHSRKLENFVLKTWRGPGREGERPGLAILLRSEVSDLLTNNGEIKALLILPEYNLLSTPWQDEAQGNDMRLCENNPLSVTPTL